MTTQSRIADLAAVFGRRLKDPFLGRVARAALARPFSQRSGRKLCIYYEDKRISFAQIYPFLHYARTFAERLDTEIRCVPIEALRAGRVPLEGADAILLQIWFTAGGDEVERVLERLARAAPKARIAFIDSFAHSDLRLARHVEPYISAYLKKSLLRNRELFFRPFRNDTNLTEYYSDLYGLPGAPVDWQVPRAILSKLHLSPNFFTSPQLLPRFLDGTRFPLQGDRRIDLHARLGRKGTPWYQAMRTDALRRVEALAKSRPGFELASDGSLPWRDYMREMSESKICFSPFGFGEVCWRDVEAILSGSVLLKPDMSHLDTLPDLYVDDETYIACAWDFSDLEDKIDTLLHDPARRMRIAESAYSRVVNYLRTDRFVDDMAFLVAP